MGKYMRRVLSVLLVFVLVCVSCIFDHSTGVNAKANQPTKITLNKKSASMSVGETLTLKVKTVKPSGASKNVTWKTSNKKVATVSSKGKVEAKKKGTVTITAVSKSNSKVTAKCKIKVNKAVKPTKITLNEKNTSMSVGDTLTLKVKAVKPEKASKNVTWKTSDKKVATVSSKGKVTAKKNGTVTITAVSKSNSKVTAKCKIKVYKATKTLKLNNTKKSYTLTVGQTQKLSAKVTNPKKGAAPVTWSSGNSKVAKVNSSGKVTAAAKGKATITGKSGKKKVTVKITVKEADTPKAVTRAQWTAMLVDKMGYTIEKESLNVDVISGEILYEYDDIAGHTYAEKIETAYCYGIIPAVELTDGKVHTFEPDSPVTREFVAYTVMHALGFAGEEALSSTDANQLSYPKEDKLAVDLGMLSLKNGAFLPTDVLAEGERVQIEAFIDRVLADRVIDENHQDIIIYQENVVEETAQITDYTVTEEGVVVLPNTSITAGLNKGDILILPETEDFPNGLVIKAASVAENSGSGAVAVKGEVPDLQEVYSRIDIEGASNTLAGDIELAEGVTAVGVDVPMPLLNVEGSVDPSVKKSWKVKLEDGSVTGTAELSFEIPEIRYALDWDLKGRKINKFYLEVPSTVVTDFKMTGKLKDRKELATIPLKLQAGFSVDIVVSVVSNVDGKLELKYSLDNSIGVQYIGGNVCLIKNMKQSFEGNMEVTAMAGMDMQLKLKWVDFKKIFNKGESKPIYSIGTQLGVGAKASIRQRPTGLVCNNVGIWLYWDTSVGEGSMLAELFSELKHTWNIFDESSSPLKKELHFEKAAGENQYKQVSKCTYGREVLYSGTYRGMDWEIDKNGKLEIYGKYVETAGNDDPAWLKHAEEIKTAVVTAVNVKSTCRWFDECVKLEQIDLSNFDTSQVINMSRMFYYCDSLTSLDVSSFDTSQVTNMFAMFCKCSSLTSLDVSGFNTSQVTDMEIMFGQCSSLTSLDVSRFNTSQVTNMFSMFSGCSSLASLDVSGFDTSQVTNMFGMFFECSSLTSLDVSGFNTSQVTDMYAMFFECSSLTSLDVSRFDTSQVTNMGAMFGLCSNLTSLDVSRFNTSQVTNMYALFNTCSNLTSLDLSSFDMGQVTDMSHMLAGCKSLSQLKVPLNVQGDCMLPSGGTWKDERGNIYKYLPKYLTSSFTIKKY